MLDTTVEIARRTTISLVCNTMRPPLILEGSAATVTEFFEVCLNSILFQRQIYSTGHFKSETKWGLPQMMAASADLKTHLQKIINQLRIWLVKGSITQLTLTIADSANTAVESWRFQLHLDATDTESENDANAAASRLENLRAVLRQINMSVTFLPVLTESEYTFYVSVTECDQEETPPDWAESEARQVHDPQKVSFKSLDTGFYSVDIAVEYARPSL